MVRGNTKKTPFTLRNLLGSSCFGGTNEGTVQKRGRTDGIWNLPPKQHHKPHKTQNTIRILARSPFFFCSRNVSSSLLSTYISKLSSPYKHRPRTLEHSKSLFEEQKRTDENETISSSGSYWKQQTCRTIARRHARPRSVDGESPLSSHCTSQVANPSTSKA